MKRRLLLLLTLFLFMCCLPSCSRSDVQEAFLDIGGRRYQILLSSGLSSSFSDGELSFSASPGEGHMIDLSGLNGCMDIHSLSFRLYEKTSEIVVPLLPELTVIRVECPYVDKFSFEDPNGDVTVVFTGLLKNYTSAKTPERLVFEGTCDLSAFSRGQTVKELELGKPFDLATVRKLSPVRLTLMGTGWDLSGLQGWNLDTLILEGDPAVDLSLLRECGLRSLILHSAPSLRGLEGSGIETLQISDNVTKDISSLSGIDNLKTLILLVEDTGANWSCDIADAEMLSSSLPVTPLDREVLSEFLAKGGVIKAITESFHR